MSEEVKDTRILFRISKDHLDSLDKFAKELKLSRSKVIRLGIDTLIEKYRPGYKGEWVIMNTELLNTIIGNLGARIHELENPKGTVASRVRKAGTTFAWLEDKKKQ